MACPRVGPSPREFQGLGAGVQLDSPGGERGGGAAQTFESTADTTCLTTLVELACVGVVSCPPIAVPKTHSPTAQQPTTPIYPPVSFSGLRQPRPVMMAANPPSAGFDGKGSLGLTTAELRALEATRFRLQNLSNSLASFKNDIFMNKPLPNPCVSLASLPV